MAISISSQPFHRRQREVSGIHPKRVPQPQAHIKSGKTLASDTLHFGFLRQGADFPAEDQQAKDLNALWADEKRWGSGEEKIKRNYSAEDVVKARPTIRIDNTLARAGAEHLWAIINEGKIGDDKFIGALGALTGNQAVQQSDAGLRAIYASGWQVAADNNTAGDMYPDQSLYSANSMPKLVESINNALLAASRNDKQLGIKDKDRLLPIVADIEAGFGGNLNAYELAKAAIKAGASGLHIEDQLSSAKKCGHLGGKVLIPTREGVKHLIAARLAADVMGTPTVIIARTDALGAKLITSDIDDIDKEFIKPGERTEEGFYYLQGGDGREMKRTIARGLAFAPYADMLWFETSKPDLKEAKEFADAIHAKYPNKLLAYNCSPSFNWKKNMSAEQMKTFQKDLAKLGYKFQFVTLAGFHTLNHSMFKLAKGYKDEGMHAYSTLVQEPEDASGKDGYRATEHQAFVGVPFFDYLEGVISGGKSSTRAYEGSTADQFKAN